MLNCMVAGLRHNSGRRKAESAGEPDHSALTSKRRLRSGRANVRLRLAPEKRKSIS